MATEVTKKKEFTLLDNTKVEVKSLNIKRLREFMKIIKELESVEEEIDTLGLMAKATAIAVEPARPDLVDRDDEGELLNTQDKLEEVLDVPLMWEIFEVAGGVKMGDPNQMAAGLVGEELDLAALEAEVFLLGHWENYDDLEEKLSMPELTATLEAMREREKRDRTFFAALKGIDLRDEEDKLEADDDAPTFADIQARVYGDQQESIDILNGMIGHVVEGDE